MILVLQILLREMLSDKAFDVTSDLQLQNPTMNATATSTNRDEALKKYWFCNGKCEYSFTKEDFDWNTNIQTRYTIINEMKQKVARAKNAYKYLNELISLDTKINFTKIASDLELDLDEQMTVDNVWKQKIKR